MQRAGMARRILVAELALEHIRDRFEAAMRMVGRAFGLARRVVDRAHFVEQQERIEVHQQAGGKRAVDDKAAAFGRANGGKRAFDRACRAHQSHLEKWGIALFLKHGAIIGTVFRGASRPHAMDCSITGTMR